MYLHVLFTNDFTEIAHKFMESHTTLVVQIKPLWGTFHTHEMIKTKGNKNLKCWKGWIKQIEFS
jgi:hypothetical protein